MKSGRVVGILLIFGGAALGLIGGLWLAAGVLGRGGSLQVTGALLGGGLLAVVVLPVIGVGVFLVVRSGQEAKAGEETAKMRKVLDIVKSRGQVPVSDLVLELKSSRDQVQGWIHSLVGMGVFSGFINWDEGVLYSAEAAQLRNLDKCKHCGGELNLAGRGVLRCSYCGTEYFLP
ncbi:MAG: hypothetical protein HY784_10980 [Chloroflexi bacterium]|nr:hypothetical protein [Chloroflexota bacterium]